MNKIEQSSMIVFVCIILITVLIGISMLLPSRQVPKINLSKSEPIDWSDTLTTKMHSETTNTVQTTTKKTTKKQYSVQTTQKTTQATGDKNTYIEYAREYSSYDTTQMECLINLWNRESGWNPNAVNRSSGACGIPQALPCSKIANKYGDNSYQSQIKWGIDYINARYGNACEAWQHFKTKGWY